MTQAQHSRLDRMAGEHPDAKVVGLVNDGAEDMPVIRLSDGTHRKLVPSGRLKNLVHYDAAEQVAA